MINAILSDSGRILRQFENRDEAEEWLANVADENGVLTETGYAGQSIELFDAE